MVNITNNKVKYDKTNPDIIYVQNNTNILVFDLAEKKYLFNISCDNIRYTIHKKKYTLEHKPYLEYNFIISLNNKEMIISNINNTIYYLLPNYYDKIIYRDKTYYLYCQNNVNLFKGDYTNNILINGNYNQIIPLNYNYYLFIKDKKTFIGLVEVIYNYLEFRKPIRLIRSYPYKIFNSR